MKRIILVFAFLIFNSLFAQQNNIKLQTEYGSKNKEIRDILRFQEIETIQLNFSGKSLKGKDYILLVKEFTNGKFVKTDTLVDTKKSQYLTNIRETSFDLKFFVKTNSEGQVKMSVITSRFSLDRLYETKKSEDKYALHDFLGGKEFLEIEQNQPTYILGYFLPYLHKESGFKSYCDVSGSEYKPEGWGEKMGIPNYFLVEIKFE